LAAIRGQYYGQKGLATASFLCGHGHKAISKSGPKRLLFLAPPGFRGSLWAGSGARFWDIAWRRQQPARRKVFHVERCSRNVLRFAFLRRNVVSNGIGECVRLAFIEQDGDDGQTTFRVGVDEVGNHVITAPVHVLFAGMMKVELPENVGFMANGESAAGWVVI
jgi:hypothetical protein